MDDPIRIATSLYRPNHVPTLEEAVAVVGECADAVASMFLADRGLAFKKATCLSDASRLATEIPSPLEGDPVGYAAYLYQYECLARMPGFGLSRTAKVLIGIGDECFYDGTYEVPDKYDRQTFALYCYQLAAGIDPGSEQGAWDAMTVCWQGNFDSEAVRFRAALPYAIVVAALNPRRNEVAEVMKMIGQR
jgi:hypothetical protein